MAFVLYRLPESAEAVFIEDKSPLKATQGTDLLHQQGFIFAPFSVNNEQPYWLLQPKKHAKYTLTELNHLPLPISAPESVQTPVVTDKSTYLKQCRRMVTAFEKGKLEKAILSRIKETKLARSPDLMLLFQALCQAYPNAFVHLCQLPDGAIWMGSSPEVLATVQHPDFSTMALAGTQKWQGHLPPWSGWGKKEQEEQQYVATYISEILEKYSRTIRISGPASVQAGKVIHLCSKFYARLGEVPAAAVIEELHPTPAVCGWPAKTAENLIKDTEIHHRSYYAGYLGPVHSETKMQLFVNLRCMQIRGNSLYLYMGGGLTAASHPEKEWQETELKAQTLLAVIEKMQNFET